MFFALALLFLVPLHATIDIDEDYLELNTLALLSGTDKGSSSHDYTRIYSKLFAPLREQPIRFLEIGIWGGESVRMWESYFPNAEMHFIDIDPGAIKYFTPRAQYHFIDQTDTVGLQTLAESVGGFFDVIIDDGGHQMVQQIVSFQTLFPYIKRGGMYIIEDLHTSYWQGWGGHGSKENPQAGSDTTIEFLQHLIHDLNYTGAATGSANYDLVSPHLKRYLNYYQQNIESIQFYKSFCIITKR